jgi:hypothetical protein
MLAWALYEVVGRTYEGEIITMVQAFGEIREIPVILALCARPKCRVTGILRLIRSLPEN